MGDGPGDQTQSGLQAADVDPAPDQLGEILPVGGQEPDPLRLGKAAPDPVGLAGDQGVRGALGPDRTGPADALGGDFTAEAGSSAFTVRMEELGAVAAPAGAMSLPVPDVRRGSWQPAHVRHGFASRVD